MALSAADSERISAAICAAEQKTSGEIVCVLARRSADSTALPIFLAAVIALIVPWALLAFTAFSADRILLLQIIAFAVAMLVFCLPRVRVALLPRRARRAAAHRAAMQQFVIRSIARKKDRCGILIFVSLAERYARIVADDGIAARVPQAQWQAAVDALTTHMSNGAVADGFIAAIGTCETLLAEHFPRSETSRDELPDRIYVI